MTLDKQVNVRLSSEQHQRLTELGQQLAAGLKIRRRVTVSDVVRLAVEDYLRRNG